MHENRTSKTTSMTREVIINALAYSAKNFLTPIFVHSQSMNYLLDATLFNGYDPIHIIPVQQVQRAQSNGINANSIIPVFDMQSVKDVINISANCILNVKQHEISELGGAVIGLLDRMHRVNLNITDLDARFDENLYREQLEIVATQIVNTLSDTGVMKEVSLITDLCYIESHDNCGAGDFSFAVSPAGKVYTCGGAYSDNPRSFVGDLSSGVTETYNARLYNNRNHPLCVLCDAFHCQNCVELNRASTCEVNISPSFQCRKSHIERRVSVQLLDSIRKIENAAVGFPRKSIANVGYLDPMAVFTDNRDATYGYYKFSRK